MQTQTKNTKNLDSNIQHIEKSDVITKSLKQHEIPPLIFGVRNWIMDWTTIRFGKYGGKSLPEIIFDDADYFFFLYENKFFHYDLAKEAEVLYRRARSIKVPPKNGKEMFVKYFFYYDKKFKKDKFLMMKLIPDGSDPGRYKISSWIDFYEPRSYSDFDKTGYKNFVRMLKGILFGNRSYPLDCELFFNRQRYFDLRRVEELQL